MEEIEHASCQIERRIGVHERDVLILEERCKPMAHEEAFAQYMKEQFAPFHARRTPVTDEQMAEYIAGRKQGEQQQVEATKVISGETGGEDGV